VVQLLGEVPKDTARGIRDRAIILITYAGALRRSETVSIDWEHIDWKQKGIIITLGRTKADQEGKGEPVPIVYGDNPATCPVRALKAWQKRAGVDVGPVFRSIPRRIPDSYAGDIWQHLGPRLSDRHLYDAVKEYGAAAKLDVSRLGGHSFRAGHITEAFEREASIADVQKQARHADVRNTMRYNRGSDLLRHSSSAKLGL
jgi:integrase